MTINKLFLTLLSITLTLFICINKEVDAQDVAVKIGVVLDKESMEGKIGLSSMKMAISDFYAAHPYFKTRIVLHVRHSKRHDVLMAAAAALDLVKNERVAAIIGPQTSSEAQFVTNLGKKAHVPIVSYSVTSPSVSPSKNKYFIRATQNDSSQVQPITALIQSFEWRELVLVCLDDDDDQCGGGFMPVLANDLQKIGTRVSDRSVMPSSASDDQIEAELYRLKSMPTRVFVVHVMEISIGSRIFLAANRLGMMGEEYVWIVTSAMGNVLESLDRRVLQSMQGVLGVQSFVPRTREMENFVVRWNVKFRQEYPNVSNFGMSIVGLRAYDAAISIARAVKEVGVTNFTFQSSDNAIDFGCSEGKVTDSPNTSCSSIGVSKFGQQLLQAIHQTRFKGLGGNFILVNGQLQSSTFRLINVWGNRVNEVGFWNESSGLILDNLKPIIWPEGLKLAPKGWVVSPNGKKLKIGVPVKNGFVQFVKVDQNHNTGKPKVTGYCIDVFDAVMKKLPYFVSYEYIPFTERVGEPTNSYNTLVDQVYLKKFDAVVGDITIRANRTSFVDFTFPYTESGVVMIVPLKNNKEIRAWLFIKPLTWDLWVVAFCSFIFIAFVVWVLEHRINEDFRGPPGHQAGTSLYYSFSTLVFSHSFNVFNNLTRFVVIIWVFVVLILIQSYTANLASLLTVEQLQPTVTNVDELIRRGETIGFQEGSFVENLLINMKFRPSKLKSYNTTLQLHELLAQGTQNGGIAAAFDELPYVKIFLAEYGSKYTMVPPTYKTDGFGFVFPKGSPLGLDVSREVLTVMESEEMTEIENKWFKQSNRPDLGDSLSSTSLGLDSFWGLFTIAGVSALVALIIYSVGFLKEHKSVLYDDDASIWTRFMTLMSIYDQKNLNSHTFKKGQPQDQSVIDTSTNTPYPQSPSNFWNDSDRELNCYEQSTPSSEKFCSDSSRMERVDVLTTPV